MDLVLKKRPYADEEAKSLLGNLMSPETTEWHYAVHQKGYVDKFNEIQKTLGEKKAEIIEKANGNYSEFGELKRRETFNANGVILHEIFWENIGGNGDSSKAPQFKKAIEEEYGSVENFLKELKACALSAKNSGWAVTAVINLGGKKIRNLVVDEHGVGNIWGSIPIIALDVFEHAYYHKDGAKKAKYVDNFIASIAWERVEERYKKAIATMQ